MTTLFRLDTSVMPSGSRTRELADTIEQHVSDALPSVTVTPRDVGQHPLDSSAWALNLQATETPDDQWTPAQRTARSLASDLAEELEAADGYLFTAPLYNWGVSQHLKTWVDVVATDRRFRPRTATVAGRPAVLVVARGGDYRPGSPQTEWDHATAWMRRILGDVWGLDVSVIEVNLTLAPTREYMAHLRDAAAEDNDRAVALAHAEGTRLANLLKESR